MPHGASLQDQPRGSVGVAPASLPAAAPPVLITVPSPSPSPAPPAPNVALGGPQRLSALAAAVGTWPTGANTGGQHRSARSSFKKGQVGCEAYRASMPHPVRRARLFASSSTEHSLAPTLVQIWYALIQSYLSLKHPSCISIRGAGSKATNSRSYQNLNTRVCYRRWGVAVLFALKSRPCAWLQLAHTSKHTHTHTHTRARAHTMCTHSVQHDGTAGCATCVDDGGLADDGGAAHAVCWRRNSFVPGRQRMHRRYNRATK